ncbi:hypothetical protein [Streptomyces sp. AV19]|uniref:hypothetical protein n=1 Tax=Streptomyces sp. AV19 TaxID=2793068 RepID=UPI001F1A9C96|nr:hypothetical protein [Streptomyces sp. AV19]MDG4536632.1 hypothetical protein [Streptomyces sp. AV19]
MALTKKFGPAHAGSSAGDFGLIGLKDAEGWAVTGHHNDVLIHIGPDEPQDQSEITVGLSGRSKRHRDGTDLHTVHVEDKRGSGGLRLGGTEEGGDLARYAEGDRQLRVRCVCVDRRDPRT